MVPSQREFDTYLTKGQQNHNASQNPDLDLDSRFTLAYSASHSLATAALRYHGYRPKGNRFTEFQALTHTLGLEEQSVVLAEAHRRRNRMEYEAELFEDMQFLEEMIQANQVVLDSVNALDPIV